MVTDITNASVWSFISAVFNLVPLLLASMIFISIVNNTRSYVLHQLSTRTTAQPVLLVLALHPFLWFARRLDVPDILIQSPCIETRVDEMHAVEIADVARTELHDSSL